MSGKATHTEEASIQSLENRYQITLTDRERMLLVTSKGLLGPIEKQEAFLLGIALASKQCPACLSEICQRSAAPGGLDFKAPDDRSYECPRCRARLEWHVALIGDPFFTIHPDEARPVTS